MFLHLRSFWINLFSTIFFFKNWQLWPKKLAIPNFTSRELSSQLKYRILFKPVEKELIAATFAEKIANSLTFWISSPFDILVEILLKRVYSPFIWTRHTLKLSTIVKLYKLEKELLLKGYLCSTSKFVICHYCQEWDQMFIWGRTKGGVQ